MNMGSLLLGEQFRPVNDQHFLTLTTLELGGNPLSPSWYNLFKCQQSF